MTSVQDPIHTNQKDAICTTTSSVSSVANPNKCKRMGCKNPAIDHPEWDGEYCSTQCLSLYCKEAFSQWVKKHQ